MPKPRKVRFVVHVDGSPREILAVTENTRSELICYHRPTYYLYDNGQEVKETSNRLTVHTPADPAATLRAIKYHRIREGTHMDSMSHVDCSDSPFLWWIKSKRYADLTDKQYELGARKGFEELHLSHHTSHDNLIMHMAVSEGAFDADLEGLGFVTCRFSRYHLHLKLRYMRFPCPPIGHESYASTTATRENGEFVKSVYPIGNQRNPGEFRPSKSLIPEDILSLTEDAEFNLKERLYHWLSSQMITARPNIVAFTIKTAEISDQPHGDRGRPLLIVDQLLSIGNWSGAPSKKTVLSTSVGSAINRLKGQRDG